MRLLNWKPFFVLEVRSVFLLERNSGTAGPTADMPVKVGGMTHISSNPCDSTVQRLRLILTDTLQGMES